MNNYIHLGELISTISKTHKFEKDKLVFLNTSDVLEGKILVNHYTDISELKGQAKKTIQNGDILYSEIRPKNRRYAFVKNLSNPEDFVVSTKLMVLRKKSDDLDTDYLYYFLTSTEAINYLQSRAENRIGSFPQITFEVLKKLKIRLPSLNIQKKIAKILSDLDTKIELNNKINTELEQMVKTLYDYWFVQFDFPDANGKPYKSSGGEMVYNIVLKREIPKGWGVKQLQSCIKKIIDYRGRTPKKLGSDWSQNINDIIALSAKHVKGGKLVSLKEANRVDEKLYQKWMKEELQEGDILMTSEAPCGEFFYLIGETKYCLSQRLFAMRADLEVINNACLFYELSVGNGYSQIMGKVSGSTVFGIRQDELRTVNILIPPTSLQKAFQENVYPIYQRIRNNEKQNQELTQLRDWLLPMLMNGQVAVADAKEMVNEQLGMVVESPADNQLKLTDKDKKIRRKMLATYIINQSLNDTSFGKTKFEKLLHLIECHIVRGNYNQRYSVQAAGPYDGGFTKVFWNEVTKAKWFKIEEFGRLKRIMPAENHPKSLVDYGYLSEDLKLMINDFISEFKTTNYERPEIISTLYAVWNNRIIRKEMITDELLKKDFLEWDTQKERYKDRLDNALLWMRENGIIPDGWGNEIKRAKK